MKSLLRRPIAVALATVMAVTMVPVRAADSPAIGNQLLETVHPLQDGTTLTRGSYYNTYYNGPREEMYVTYTPGMDVIPLVSYGSSVTGTITGTAALDQLEAQGYRVIAGINGDFFDSNGVPTGILVSGGRLLSSDGTNYAVGFRQDGTATIGMPNLMMTASINGQDSVHIAGFNKARSDYGGIYCYTYEFKSAHNTGTVAVGVDVYLEAISEYEATGMGNAVPPTSANPMMGVPTYYRVVSVNENPGGAAPIAPNQLVLSVNQAAAQWELNYLRNMVAGDILTLTATPQNPEFTGVTEAVGALYPLVANGQICSGLDKTNAPRSAIGIKANGEVVIYAIDGRQSAYSIGCSQSVLAQRMLELGCVTAICLDGGGSTTASITQPYEKEGSVINRPSGGSERKVTNHLFLVSTESATGIPAYVAVHPGTPMILSDSQLTLAGTVVDTAYYPMETKVTFGADRGTVSGDVYTAPTTGGTDEIYGYSGNISGSILMQVIDTPNSIALEENGTAIGSISLEPGESIDLTAVATYNRMEIPSSDTAYDWSVSGNVGTVDENGVFTAGSVPTTGTLTVTKGTTTHTIPVTVTTKTLITLEDFEDGIDGFSGYQLNVSEAPNAFVRFGNKALKVEYTLEGGAAGLSLGFAQKEGYDTITFWVYGDGSGNTLSLYDENGMSIAAGTLDFTGWKQMSVTLPDEIGTLSAMLISGQTAGGTLYFDQFVASYGGMIDTAAPVIEGSITENSFTATVKDAIEGVITPDKLTLTVDGQAISYELGADGILRADLSQYIAAGGTHRLSLLAQDASGNLARKSWDFGTLSLEEIPFGDLTYGDGTSHWATSYLLYLNQQGIINGFDENGVKTVKPDNAMTRAEFAVTLMRWMGIDENAYADVELPFADVSQIADWMMPAAKAMYAMGVMSGSGHGDGTVTFDPQATITRAQAITMLGRIQEKGYQAVDLSTFPDGSKVADWARPYLETMVAQGIISGLDDGSISPDGPLTRGQACKILYMMW